jgi:hypothetical protein
VWQGYLWLFYPSQEDFPYAAYAPILIGSLVALLILGSRQAPGSERGAGQRFVKGIRVAVVALAVWGALALGLLYVSAAGRVARLTPPSGAGACSQAFYDSTVAMEDGNFYRHRGFDLVAMHRALRANLRSGRIVQGGSTITQQLAKNLFLTNDRTLGRKLQEALYAVALERRFSKRQLLQLYVRNVDYGLGQHGISQAAGFYFHTTPGRLTLAQSALLVGMVPYAPQQWPAPEKLDRGRATALGRLAYWFPGRYTPEEIRSAESMPLASLLPGMPHEPQREAR